VPDTCKRYPLANLEALWCLSKYLFFRKDNDILERDSKNKYVVENED
jgi:hypothetical protein